MAIGIFVLRKSGDGQVAGISESPPMAFPPRVAAAGFPARYHTTARVPWHNNYMSDVTDVALKQCTNEDINEVEFTN